MGQIRARTEKFKASCYPHCLLEWNKLDPQIRTSPTIGIFKKKLCAQIRPPANSVYGIHDPKGVANLTQLRVGLSKLNFHKFRHNFRDTMNQMCPINDGIEDAEHFLLLCDSFKEHRYNLVTDVNAVLQNGGHSVWSNSFLQLLLYGDESLSYEANRSILTLTITMNCISDVRSWMGANKLMLNDQKSEYMIVTKNVLPDDVKLLDFKIGESVIEPSESLRNLGSRWDKHMNMSTNVANISKACFMQLRNLWSIKKFIGSDTLATLNHAFVTSKLDYGNALLYGIPKTTVSRLQYMQNCAARLIRGARKFNHVTPLLIDLHWLPMTYRPMFKILLTVFKIPQGRAPEYLTELITIYNPGRYLRSNGSLILNVPRSNTKSWGDRAFSIAGPRLWNSLPIELRMTTNIVEFKSRLKTHLFKVAFEGYL